MYPRLLSFALLLTLYVCLSLSMAVSEDMLEVKSDFGVDCSLQCTAKPKPGVQYRAVRWYKVREPPSPSRLSGLLTKDLPNGTTRWYANAAQKVELLDESHTISLPNVTCSDGGAYVCHLAAPVGEQNREGEVLLTVTGCDHDVPTEKLVTDASMVIIATVVLICALIIFRLSYVSLKNTLKDRNKTPKKETLLDAPLKPLDKKDLMLIYTLGPKTSKQPTIKHVCV